MGVVFVSLQGRRSQPFNQKVLYNNQKFLISWNVMFMMRNLGRWQEAVIDVVSLGCLIKKTNQIQENQIPLGKI